MENNAVSGAVEKIRFCNEQNGYAVFDIAPDKAADADDQPDELITCVGVCGPLREGYHVELRGSFVIDPTYGRQFRLTHCQAAPPSGAAGIARFLASGAIAGVGEKTAARIIEKWGEQALEVICDYPDRLPEIKGITKKKAAEISASFHEQRERFEVMVFLQEYGVSAAQSVKIHKKYGKITIDLVKNNPYTLCEDINGIGFKTADELAAKLGTAPDSPHRIKSAILYLLNEAAGSGGHIYTRQSDLSREAAALLGLRGAREELIAHSLNNMQVERVICRETLPDGDFSVYLSFFYYAETFVARKLLTICGASITAKPGEIDAVTKDFDPAQRQAVERAMLPGALVITGGPGTGKTTTLNAIIELFAKRGLNVELAAPTGRAAKRLCEATGREAKTIHRLLETSFVKGESVQHFERDENRPLEADVVILDECSMLDLSLTYHLAKALPQSAKLILVGDADQLPSVGAGNVLRDIIASGGVNVATLKTIFRQAAKSAIITNAHRINSGLPPLLNEKDKDFFFIPRSGSAACLDTITELVSSRLPKYLNTSDIFDIQALSPMRKSELGVESLNARLQDALNPRRRGKKEKTFRRVIFREGDKIMQTKNNYGLSYTILGADGSKTGEGAGIYNGDIGLVRSIDDESESLFALYDDRLVRYDYAQLEDLDLSYAVTIHKSQGNEYRAVVLPLLGGPPCLLSRNLLYTAITRARDLVVVVGSRRTLEAMVDNNREVDRNTTLKERLRHLSAGDALELAPAGEAGREPN
ncbi:MAG: ATP-dependent RecD-like DNA helicase [Clostridiales bacterium]|jgi:exodeoxyribonuclease V alpha subunit|nr:ATP-dependent RecD-like DNA helicase [Clostridiales bacterium]